MSFKKVGAPAPVIAPPFQLDQDGNPITHPVKPAEKPQPSPQVKPNEVYPRGPFS